MRSDAVRRWPRSTSARVCSISASYFTPDGHAVMQAMHPRQRSKWRTTDGVKGSVPSASVFIRRIRPRGESISWPHDW
jgi:hypothetical protein